ncbi:thioredoxin domain-containing protein [Desulfotomaculum nigrificans]|uniref:thioredoxin domain-containing protein n=1 Tax=Desulfotomaculum nigrificans TaxID=1565 RepID=UPI0001FAE739|nr:thioredoxin domain-containing protein [Desulfotomaculum nigrificans]
MERTEHKPNRLIHEKSPYLLQHAYNPVDWYPWGEEAFEKAKRENKPVFLSIGYSTCHWCHVMERESFESEDVAEVLNKYYVAIKVDREERPDIDQIYMTVCQALTGQGGWPLNIIMTPDQKPFFAGTYFPKNSNYGKPGLIDILQQIADLWAKNRQQLLGISDQLMARLNMKTATAPGQLSPEVLDKAYLLFARHFDSTYGGFGNPPKFPTPHNLMLLLRCWKKTSQKKALTMVEDTLDAMHRGGIYDHIGFGFSRYSTDRRWLVPHFEKMLYDNALLAIAFLETYQINRNPRFSRVAKEIFTYVLRDMTAPEGGFYSAEDADSEGVEGKFYVWHPQEVEQVLGQIDGQLFCRYYDITPRGNFEGASIPNLINQDPLKFAQELDITLEDLVDGLEKCRQLLFAQREKRVHPHKDDKILTSWNGLMIAALARGARVLGDEKYSQAAEKAVDFIYHNLQRADGRLLARYRDGEAAYPAYLDDYAFLIWGLLELYEATFDIKHLEQAVQLTDSMIDLFWDRQNGGFFFYGKDSEQLISRPKEIYDGAIPSGNSVATVNLFRLARLTERNRYEELATKQLQVFAGELEHYPIGYSYFMIAAYLNQEPPTEIVLSGKREDSALKQMIDVVQKEFLPSAVLAVRYEGEAAAQAEELVPLLKDRLPVAGKATAYVCKNFACQPPVTDLDQLMAIISRGN